MGRRRPTSSLHLSRVLHHSIMPAVTGPAVTGRRRLHSVWAHLVAGDVVRRRPTAAAPAASTGGGGQMQPQANWDPSFAPAPLRQTSARCQAGAAASRIGWCALSLRLHAAVLYICYTATAIKLTYSGPWSCCYRARRRLSRRNPTCWDLQPELGGCTTGHFDRKSRQPTGASRAGTAIYEF